MLTKASSEHSTHLLTCQAASSISTKKISDLEQALRQSKDDLAAHMLSCAPSKTGDSPSIIIISYTR